MKKLIICIAAVAFSNSITYSQGCLPEGISIHTQAQIDSFPINYPGCSEIEGDVTILGGTWPDEINSLEGLSVLTSIGGSLSIGNHYLLTNLSGLNSLTSVGGDLRIGFSDSYWAYYNSSLTSIAELSALTSVGGMLQVSINESLTSLAGLDNIDAGSITDLTITANPLLSSCEVESVCTYLANPNGVVNISGNAAGCNSAPEVADNCGITLPCLPFGIYYFSLQADIDNFQTEYPGCIELGGDVYISGNDITNLNGFNAITSISGDVYIAFTSITNMTGFENLSSIGGNLSISHNNNLFILTGLEGLNYLMGNLSIYENNALTSLTGLENIDSSSIVNLYIFQNFSLSNCAVQSICNYLTSPDDTIVIYENALGCNSPEEVEAACLTAIESTISNKEISIYPNPGKDFLIISTQNGVRLDDVAIYNLAGQKVLQSKPVDNTLDISKLQPGMYIIELMTDQEKVREKLIVE